MRNKELREKIKEVSLGVLNSLIDLNLFIFAFWAQTYRVGSGKKDIFEAIEDSAEFVTTVRKEYFKRGVYQATKKGYLKKVEKEKGSWQVTELGNKRLGEILPKYNSVRPWDGRIYLVTYDIPEKRKKDRELLREYLKRIGCGMLQASVWLTPYDPKRDLAEFIKEWNLSGFIIVSDIGKDGNVGQIPIRELVKRVYYLDKLNERYRGFLEKTKARKVNAWETSCFFLSILKDDPQLPFQLLPANWFGDKAYQAFCRFFSLKI